MKNKTTKMLCINALGIALYVALSMMAKIPVIGHIGLDIGYIVLAVFCYMFGGATGAIVGACGCTLVSLLTSGWFPPGWVVANVVIGLLLGYRYKVESKYKMTILGFCSIILFTYTVVFLGVGVVKSYIECWMFNIPIEVKLPKNTIAALMDATCMIIGYLIAPMISKANRKSKQ